MIAPNLYRVLAACAASIAAGLPIDTILEQGREELERAGFRVDYLEARHAETLQPVRALGEGPVRLLAAARLGTVRLIDNVAVGNPESRKERSRPRPRRRRS